MTFNNFHYAMSLANTLYGLNLSPDNFEEMGVVAQSKIGNKRTRLYRITLDVSCKNTVDLPCNCDIIEAITYGFEDWNWVTNLTNNGDWSTNFTEHYIEARKMFENPLYVSGKYVKYERVGNTLYLDNNYGGKINLLYKGEVLDDDGLPQITDKEAEAIAAFCAYTVKYKEGLQTNNVNIINLANDLKRNWCTLCDAARVSEELSQNEMDEILDAKSSWNRKVFGKSYKPIK